MCGTSGRTVLFHVAMFLCREEAPCRPAGAMPSCLAESHMGVRSERQLEVSLKAEGR
jgi:hypothetical protein